jgi:predicted HTH domain antitoxin
MSSTVTIEVPDAALELLGNSEAKLGRELLVAAVLRWFEEGRLSQGQAAKMLSLDRGDFFRLLDARRISPVQMSVEDLEEDFRRG